MSEKPKNILQNLVPSKLNPIDRNYTLQIDDSVDSTQPGISGTNIFDELVRLINDRSDRSLLPDGNTFSAVIVEAVEMRINNSRHACMVPRDLWNAFSSNPDGLSMYKCRVAIDFRDCIKPPPDYISNDRTDMKTKDIVRSQNYSLAFGLFAKAPQVNEEYEVKILNKTKDFCGDEIIILDKRATYDAIKKLSMKNTLKQSGANDTISRDTLPVGDAGDVDALTRTLVVETSYLTAHHPEAEFAGVCWVAINRARNAGRSLQDTLYPPGKPNWNGSSTFAQRWSSAHTHPNFNAAKVFVDRLLIKKEIPNPIQDCTNFVHPKGLKACNISSPCKGKRKCVGGRCLPLWSVPVDAGGTAKKVITIGKAIFSKE